MPPTQTRNWRRWAAVGGAVTALTAGAVAATAFLGGGESPPTAPDGLGLDEVAATIVASAGPSAVPSPTEEEAQAVPTAPPPTYTPAPVAGQPPPAPTPITCSGSLQALVDGAGAGGTLNLTGCAFNGTLEIKKPLTIIGARLTTQTSDQWATSVSIKSDNVTLDRWAFSGGGQVVAIFGQANIRIANSTFDDQIGGAVTLWGGASGSRNVVIENNRVTQTRTIQVSPMGGRGSEDCSVFNRNVTFRNNVIDQGPGTSNERTTVGWFGIELKCFDGVVIEGNTIKGGLALVSLPDSNNVLVRSNVFDLRGHAFWGVEVAKANDVTVEGNTFVGDGPDGDDHAVSLNSGSLRTIVRNNKARDVRTLVDLGGDATTVVDNCLANVLNITEFQERSGPSQTVSGNIDCAL